MSFSGTSDIANTKIIVSDGPATDTGIENGSVLNSYFRLNSSEVSAATNSVVAGTNSGQYETYISNSILEGTVTGNPACNFTFEQDGTELDNGCQPPP